jgi:hypothetical protein
MMRVQSQDALRIECHPIAATLCLVLFLLVGCATEQSKPDRLTKIPTEERNTSVRRAAVGKLTDKAVLVKIATEEKRRFVRDAAVEKLSDLGVKFSDQAAEVPITEEGPPK